ncbi:DUF2946 family protein [Schlesneria paludicola]|uniref:DUF2946 family protein n=1 Tax=Schlesneria paludicola TaxID=360056 RepID=UPI0012F716E8|nr:DUF2946 family protein [Schlesneria paludicola]
MFGRLTHLVALVAMVAHIWVNLIVAPWHHLVAHQLPAAHAGDHDRASRVEHCHCHHHVHCKPASTATRSDQQSSQVPMAPHDDDSCPVCHVLTQSFAQIEIPPVLPTRESREQTPPVFVIQPSLGALIDPVSRGPPLV